jgi:hypothetical protein
MTDSNDLSAKEMQVLALAWQCMDTDPKVRTLLSTETFGAYTHIYPDRLRQARCPHRRTSRHPPNTLVCIQPH